MRRPLTFACEGATLAGVLHPADGATGIVIVTGGTQTRAGAHRGFVDLADRLAAAGYPALRFDRRGIGDSDGADPGYRDSAPDLAAAVAALRAACPDLRKVIGWGLCDGASALALQGAMLGLDGLILANPWTRDSDEPAELPPRAVIAARYRDRLTTPSEWGRLLRGGLDLRKAARGLLRMARPEPPPQTAAAIAAGLTRFDGSVLVVLAARDATAQAFADLWRGPAFHAARRSDVELCAVPDATHTFAGTDAAAVMAAQCLEWLERTTGSSGQI